MLGLKTCDDQTPQLCSRTINQAIYVLNTNEAPEWTPNGGKFIEVTAVPEGLTAGAMVPGLENLLDFVTDPEGNFGAAPFRLTHVYTTNAPFGLAGLSVVINASVENAYTNYEDQ